MTSIEAFTSRLLTYLLKVCHPITISIGADYYLARELYRINKVRLLYDRDQPTARLVCATESELARPLDMTHSYIRAMSPIHLKYLANMRVRSSLSVVSHPGLKISTQSD